MLLFLRHVSLDHFFCRSADYFSTLCVLFNLWNDDQYFLSRLTLKPYHDSLAVANRTPKKYCFNHVPWFEELA